MARKKIVILGGGFAGLQTARRLRDVDASVTLIDRSNYHLFQPLLYQVATAGLSPGDIAAPIRVILQNKNTEIRMSEILGVNRLEKHVLLHNADPVPYDILVVATGARHSYFGHEDWEADAPGLKSIPDATEVRKRILLSFEGAELAKNPLERQRYLTMIIVGGGPTGCEMAGSIAEMTRKALTSDFRNFDPAETKILLIEAGERVLAVFPERLSMKAQQELQRLGVTVMTNSKVGAVSDSGVVVNGERIESKMVMWAAGVKASPAGRWLTAQVDNVGRVIVDRDLRLTDDKSIFVIGDTARVLDSNGQPLPGIATVALQEGKYTAIAIRAELNGKQISKPFEYFDKGSLATIGRQFAVLHRKKVMLSGSFAWLVWLFVHIFYLIGFRNKVIVLLQWAWAYLTYQRGVRLIVEAAPSRPPTNNTTKRRAELPAGNEEKAL